MRLFLLVGLLLGLSWVAAQAGAQRPASIFRVHIQTSGEDLPTTQAISVVLNDPPMTVYVKNPPFLSEHDVVAVKSTPASAGNALKIILNAHGKTRLRAATIANRGQIMVVILNGRVIYAPVIDSVIDNGVLIIPEGIYDQETEYLKEDIAKMIAEKRRT